MTRACRRERHDELHRQLDETYAQIEATLGSRSLAEMTDIPANRIS